MRHLIGIVGIVCMMCVVSLAFAQEPEVLHQDVEIMFTGSASPEWFNGADTVQQKFTVVLITYSPAPLLTNTTNTTKLGSPETWECALWQPPGEPFRKAIILITVNEIDGRDFIIRVRNRYPGDDDPSDWSVSDPDKVIGKPDKPGHKSG